MGIFLFPSPCPSAHQMAAQHRRLLSLRQGGANVKEFAYQFLFVAEGLNISDAELKDIFNTSLNKHVPAWEMGMLGILSFWQFVGYVYHRGEEVGLPPLGPPPIPRTDYLVPSPPMTRNRRRRKNGPAVAPPDAADDAAAARPVVADDATAARPEVAEDTAVPPEEARDTAAPPVEAEESAAAPVVSDDAAAPQRAAEEAAAPLEAADDAAAAHPVEANDAAASPEAAQDAALSPEAVIPPSRSCRLRRKASSVPHGLEAIQELDVG